MAEDLDRNENATPYKLEQARKRGQVSKSADMVSVIVFIVAITYFNWKGLNNIFEQFRFDRLLLIASGNTFDNGVNLVYLLERIIVDMFLLLSPLFALLLISSVVGNLIQTGPILSFKPVQPDWTRINPAEGVKRFISLQTIFTLFRTCLKLAILAPVLYFALKDLVPKFFYIASLTPLGFLHELIDDMASVGFKMALALFVIALLDWGFSNRQFSKKMRMSRREIKDEFKHREGDPRIKGRMAELRRELYKRSLALSKTSQADVLITNPTHIAVALRYTHGEMDAPQLVSKGAGFLAAVMRKIAARNNIPVVQNRVLARKLFREMDYEQHVPPKYYAEVARIIVWLFAMRKTRDPMLSTRQEMAR